LTLCLFKILSSIVPEGDENGEGEGEGEGEERRVERER
jgi:hypothetical protein